MRNNYLAEERSFSINTKSSFYGEDSGVKMSSYTLVNYLKNLLSYDSLIVLGYQKNRQARCLFSTHGNIDKATQDLVASIYTYDPFYSAFSSRAVDGVFKAEDVLASTSEWIAYREKFKLGHQSHNELAISISLNSAQHIVIFIQRDASQHCFSWQETAILSAHLSDLEVICQKLWPPVWAAKPSAHSHNLAEVIHHSLFTFGADVLTPREKEVTSLIIKGSDNKNIAEQLEISVATVKVHRKSIYNKLGIASVGELFQSFFNHLVLFSSQPLLVSDSGQNSA